MSFCDKGFWMDKGSEFLTDGDATIDDPSRIESKRSQQWFVDATESDIFPNKKQAVQAPNNKMSYGFPSSNISPWENPSNFQPVPDQFINRLFGSETARPIQYPGRDISSVGRQFVGDPSIGLSMSHAMEDRGASSSFGEMRQVKVDNVENELDIYNLRGHNSFPENKRDLTVEQLHSRKISNGFDSSSQAYKEDGGVHLMDHSFNRRDPHGKLLGLSFAKEDDIAMSIGNTLYKGDPNIISFGGFPEEQDIVPIGRLIGNCDVSYDQSSVQISGTAYQKGLNASNASAFASSTQTSKLKPETPSKNKSEFKTSRKEAPNSFPSNVRTLISTGMLDGVPVKYISLAREELRGIIKGSGYLCGCQSCYSSKVLNAYEFERHAGSKTKHPNNHIYFENGKTIYQIVQELRSTPQSLLFDTIQNVFGAPINQKSFRIWKESFQAATRELQRIYGKEELNL